MAHKKDDAFLVLFRDADQRHGAVHKLLLVAIASQHPLQRLTERAHVWRLEFFEKRKRAPNPGQGFSSVFQFKASGLVLGRPLLYQVLTLGKFLPRAWGIAGAETELVA